MLDKPVSKVMLALLGLMTGCSRPVEPATPTLARVEAQTPEHYTSLYEAAADTLRDDYFQLDRQDRDQGVLTTYPETSASWFELWRPQAEPAYYWLESNTGTIQRQATIRLLASTTQPGSYDVQVEVQRLHYSLTERQIDNAAAAMRLFSSDAPTTEGRREPRSRSGRWIPLGRDAFAEERLLSRIVNRYATLPAASRPADQFGPP